MTTTTTSISTTTIILITITIFVTTFSKTINVSPRHHPWYLQHLQPCQLPQPPLPCVALTYRPFPIIATPTTATILDPQTIKSCLLLSCKTIRLLVLQWEETLPTVWVVIITVVICLLPPQQPWPIWQPRLVTRMP